MRYITIALAKGRLAKKALEITEKYDTLQEIYFDGQGYAKDEKLAHVER